MLNLQIVLDSRMDEDNFEGLELDKVRDQIISNLETIIMHRAGEACRGRFGLGTHFANVMVSLERNRAELATLNNIMQGTYTMVREICFGVWRNTTAAAGQDAWNKKAERARDDAIKTFWERYGVVIVNALFEIFSMRQSAIKIAVTKDPSPIVKKFEFTTFYKLYVDGADDSINLYHLVRHNNYYNSHKVDYGGLLFDVFRDWITDSNCCGLTEYEQAAAYLAQIASDCQQAVNDYVDLFDQFRCISVMTNGLGSYCYVYSVDASDYNKFRSSMTTHLTHVSNHYEFLIREVRLLGMRMVSINKFSEDLLTYAIALNYLNKVGLNRSQISIDSSQRVGLVTIPLTKKAVSPSCSLLLAERNAKVLDKQGEGGNLILR